MTMLVALASAMRLEAATDTWTGGGGASTGWSNAANWGGSAPLAGDDLVFAGTASLASVNDFAAGTTFSSMTFSAGAGAFSISGNAITLNGGLANGSTTAQTIALAMILSSATTVSCSTNPIIIAGNLSGPGSLTVTGGSTLTLSGANSYGGGTTISSGTLQLGTGTVNGTIGSGTYAIASGARLYLDYATAIMAGTGTWSTRISGSGTIELNSAQAVNGSAQWGPNSSSSTVFASGFTGTLQVDNGRFDAGPAGLGGLTAIAILSGGQFLCWTGTYGVAIAIAGNGWGEAGHPGALRAAGGATVVWSGSIALSANAGINSQNSSTFTLTGQITGNFQLELEPSNFSSATMWLTPAAAVQNSYGSTRIDAGLTVHAGNPYALSTGGLAMNGGTLELNGCSFAVANLSGTGGLIGNSSATVPSLITIGSDGSSTSYAGSLADIGAAALALAKTGAGLLSLTGGSSYSGATTVSSGTFALAGSGSLGNTAISVASAATFAALPGSGTSTLGTSGAGTAGSTVTLNAGSTYSMVDGAAGTCALQQNAGFSAAALTISGATLAFDLGSGGGDALAVSGSASVSGTNTVTVTGFGSGLSGTSCTLISASGGLNGGTWQFSGGGATSLVTVGSTPYVLSIGTIATAVTLTVAPALSIAWTSGSDPKAWALGLMSLGTIANTVSSGLTLAVANNGPDAINLSIANSAAAPAGWLPAASAGANQYLMKADTTGASGAAPASPVSYDLTLGISGQPLVSNLATSGTFAFALYFQAPTSISSGSAVQQTVSTSITASLPP